MATIEKQVEVQEEKARKLKFEDNSTEAERTIYYKLRRILEHFRDNIFPDKFDIIKSKLLYSKEWEQDLRKHNMKYKSAKIYPLIMSIHETFMDSLYDNDLRPKVFPMEDVDPKVVDDAERFFQWGTEISETEQTNEIIRNEGTLIWASYWMPGYTTSVMKDEDWNNQVIFIPMLFPVSFFEMFYSVWATDFYRAPEKFRRRFMTFSELKDAFYPIWEDDWKQKGMGTLVEEKKDAIINYPNPLSKADFTKIYDIDEYSNKFIWCLWKDWIATWLVYDETFNILDSSSYVEVVDLYIWDEMMVMVNGYFVYSGKSPFAYSNWFLSNNDWPFIELTYEKWKWSLPKWIWDKIMWHQKQCNALFNSIQDAFYRNLNPVLVTVQWAVIDPTTGNSPTVINYDEGKVYWLNPSYAGISNAISKLDFTDYNMMSLSMSYFDSIKADAYTICWVNSYVLGWEWKVERSRYGAEQRVAWSKARLAPITKSIWRFYSKLFYHWLWLSQQSWATVAYIQDEDKEYVINLSELAHKFKIVCSADTNIEESKASKTQWALTMMQNMAWFAQNPITGLSDMDNEAFLSEMSKNVWLSAIKPMTLDEQKEYIDKAYDLKDYIQQKEMELQQKAQQAQPQPTTGWGQPSEEEIAMMMQQAWANPQQPSQEIPEEDLDFELPQG